MEDKAGFTLVEIMIALVILVVGLLGVLALFPVGMTASKRAGDISQAGILAQAQMDEIKEARDFYIEDPGAYPNEYPSGYPTPPPGQPFAGHPNFSWRAVVVSLGAINNLYRVDLAVYRKDPSGELGVTTKYSSEDFITYIADYD